MKKCYSFIIACLFAFTAFGQQNVGIGLTNPNPAAILEIYSNSKGLLIPRMNATQRLSIPGNLPNGLLVFDVDSGCVLAFDSVVANWKNLCALSGGTPGPAGVNGATGPSGNDGVAGPTGATGSAGLQGPSGANGALGATGAAGATGNNGQAGPTGASGNNGATGATGASGVDGLTGPTGITGATGPIGCGSSNYVIKSNGSSATCGIIYDNGTNVGIGTSTPGTQFTLVSPNQGAIQIQDGSQGYGYVLTSDSNGVGKWKQPSVNATYGVIGAGVAVPYNTTNYLYTGSYITLPPGVYSVTVYMLMTSGSFSAPTTAFWLRTTFADSTANSPQPSADIVGSALASGSLVGPAKFSLVTGSIIINNNTGANKTYYYVAGNAECYTTTATLTGFGGTLWKEDNIVAIRLQ